GHDRADAAGRGERRRIRRPVAGDRRPGAARTGVVGRVGDGEPHRARPTGLVGSSAPAAIASRELYRALFAVMRENEVADLVPKVRVRIDSALLDEVAPAFLTTRLVRRYR